MFKSGFVSIYGKPNAGKSTLFNKLIGEKISIVSPKIQTTRKTINGILTTEEYQIIFVDTPGFITKPEYELQKRMVVQIDQTKQATDISILLFDIKNNFNELQQIITENKFKKPLILVLNKIDGLTKNQLTQKINSIQDKEQFKEIISISATENKNIDTLINILVKYLPQNPAYFDGEEISDTSVRNIVAEFIREKIFYIYQDEVPYSVAVLIQEFKEKKTLIKISADIIVQREQQKIILIGSKGEKLKQVGSTARVDIEKLLDRKVFLELFVKVRNNWRNLPLYLKEFGY